MTSEHQPPERIRNVAFLGLGAMGFPMAGHLAASGHKVTVFNRTEAKSAAWCQQFSGKHAGTAEKAADGADIVFSCVGNDEDLRALLLGRQGAFAGMKPGSIFVDHTTASAEIAREMYSQARQRDLHFIDAPVSGGQSGAEAGTLTVMCGGDADVFEVVRPVIAAYSRAATLLGMSGSGQLGKMVNQIAIAGLVQGLAEAIAFGMRAKLPMVDLLQVIGQGAAQSWQMDNRGQTMVEGKFTFGFATEWMRKDLGIALREAHRNRARLPITALVDQFYGDVESLGGSRWDTSSLITRLL
jgi:3-hydroxyisobutyrate dehydrogenase